MCRYFRTLVSPNTQCPRSLWDFKAKGSHRPLSSPGGSEQVLTAQPCCVAGPFLSLGCSGWSEL